MSTASEILVIILSVFLALFLLLGIILAVYLIKLTREIRSVTKTAEKAVNSIETTVTGISRLTSPLMMAGVINKYIKKIKKGTK